MGHKKHTEQAEVNDQATQQAANDNTAVDVETVEATIEPSETNETV